MVKTFLVCFLAIAGLQSIVLPVEAQIKNEKPLPPLSLNANGNLTYSLNAQGDRMPDFSYCGYMAGEEPIPDLPVRVVVPVKKGDATLRIQSALDYVASLPQSKEGFRGAVLLEKGVYEVYGSLKINASGIVLRGSGMGESGTLLIGAGDTRQTLISIAGSANRQVSSPVKITDTYVPVNSLKVQVATTDQFKVGDMIAVHRPSTKEWIQELGADHFGGGITSLGWKPGQRDLLWDRKIIEVNGNILTFDAPLTTSLDTKYGGGSVSKYSWIGRISNSGVENLRLQSSYNKRNLKDEDHRWMAITLENVMDSWVRQVVFEHFAGSAVNVFESAKRITVEDCKSLAPVSEIGGQRRYTFMTSGQQALFQRLYAEEGYHDFAVGFCSPGPNAFVQCESRLPYSFSGTIDSWASGVLFDIVNVDGQALSYLNRGQDGQGAGWTAANSVFWQCSASRIDCYNPPTATNWAFGSWAEFAGNGYWDMSNEHINPRSLYYAQLKDRLGEKVQSRTILLPVGSEASSSPKVEVAMALTALAAKPAYLLSDFIDQASIRHPIPVGSTGVKTIDDIGINRLPEVSRAPDMKIQNGWIVRGNSILTGKVAGVQWWSGSSKPYGLEKARPHITRYVPGRTGTGLTDQLNDVTDWMKENNVVALDHNYGLWYERRRDDHERIRRMTGEVWPPFYELPFARSGQGIAWDGLSKYDLTQYNKWYWSRLKEFADLADQKGLTLIHQNYFQHNIIEAGAHYADFPWRPVNNVNHTGFPEPVPYAGDKRIFMAEQFYDITNPVRRELHRAYIRKCLDNFSDNNGVIQLLSAEYTGPLHFVQFWLDEIKRWEKEKNKKCVIGLSVTKDVQDAILTDPERASVVDLIDIRYWHYQADGSVYAPKGGQNLAPRQHARLLKPKKTSFEQVYRAVLEYRTRYPEKAVVYNSDNQDAYGWAVFMAGGSMSTIPSFQNADFLLAASKMKPLDLPETINNQCVLGNSDYGYIIYNNSAEGVHLNSLGITGSFKVRRFSPEDGKMLGKEIRIKAGSAATIEKLSQGPDIIWLTKV